MRKRSARQGKPNDLAHDMFKKPVLGWLVAEKARLHELIGLEIRSEEQEHEARALMQKRMGIDTDPNDPLVSAIALADLIKKDARSLSSSQYAWIVATLLSEKDRMVEIFMTLRTLQGEGAPKVRRKKKGTCNPDSTDV